jgi:hypothetical protein
MIAYFGWRDGIFTILRDAVVKFDPDLASRLDLLSRTANQRRVTKLGT